MSRSADTGYAMLQAVSATPAGKNASGLVAGYGGEDSDDSNQTETVEPARIDEANTELEIQAAAEESK